MAAFADVAIVGAGPYGLSVAAHLRSRGLNVRIFGRPMSTWREQMPHGMFLKSDGFASNLSDPRSSFTLKDYCVQQSIPYDHTRMPVRLETFVAYGIAFQNRMAPELEERTVVAIEPISEGFQLRLDDGELVSARRVVIAVGISHFQYVPPNLFHLPAEFLSHSSAHTNVDRFRGRSVTVIGGGASAIDLAAPLHECGAEVNVFARRHSIKFGKGPGAAERSLWQRVRRPTSGIGPGWRSRLFTDAPLLFHYLPQQLRLNIVKDYLGPAPGWFMRERIEGRVPVMTGHILQAAEIVDGRVRLSFVDSVGEKRDHMTDHVIAATGYKVDLRRLAFLSEEMRSKMRTIQETPILTSNFQSSISGLYFVGPASANSFGPVMRFAFGADYTAHRISKHLASR